MFENLKSLYKVALEKILEVEVSLKGKTGKERRDAVVDFLARLGDIAAIPNFIEIPVKKMAFGYIVDKIVEVVNLVTGWDILGTTLSVENKQKLVEIVDAPVNGLISVMSALPSTATIDERLDTLYKKYSIETAPASAPVPDTAPAPEAASTSIPTNVLAETPAPAPASKDWDRSIAFTLKWEGGYVNHPADKGGETNYGITSGALTAAIAQGIVPSVSVKNLPLESAKLIYKANYWDKYGWGNISWPGCLIVFDATVHHGGGGMARLAQCAANALGGSLVEDGKFGTKTLEAITKFTSSRPTEFAEEFLRQRKKWFDNIVSRDETQKTFLKGWYNRLSGIAKECGVSSPV
jgi:lysozyme family protein